MSTYELDCKVNELRELQSMIAELSAEVEAIKDSIKAVMIDNETETLTGNGWSASWKNVVSNRLDTKRLKAEKPELFMAYSTMKTTCRFTLT